MSAPNRETLQARLELAEAKRDAYKSLLREVLETFGATGDLPLELDLRIRATLEELA